MIRTASVAITDSSNEVYAWSLRPARRLQDLHIWKGEFPAPSRLPLVGGHEGAGYVVGQCPSPRLYAPRAMTAQPPSLHSVSNQPALRHRAQDWSCRRRPLDSQDVHVVRGMPQGSRVGVHAQHRSPCALPLILVWCLLTKSVAVSSVTASPSTAASPSTSSRGPATSRPFRPGCRSSKRLQSSAQVSCAPRVVFIYGSVEKPPDICPLSANQTVFKALKTAKLTAGESVVVAGAGGALGHLAIQYARV